MVSGEEGEASEHELSSAAEDGVSGGGDGIRSFLWRRWADFVAFASDEMLACRKPGAASEAAGLSTTRNTDLFIGKLHSLYDFVRTFEAPGAVLSPVESIEKAL